MSSVDSPHGLSSHLARMSMSHGALQDEDLTLSLGGDDDTLDLTAQQPSRTYPAAPGASSHEVAFGGSMGVVQTQQLYDDNRANVYGNAAEATTPRGAGKARFDATRTTPGTATKGSASTDAVENDYDYEEDDVDVDLESNDLSEEDRRRIVELRDERDGLRTMNRTLRSLLGGLEGMDIKLQTLGENIETAHGLLDLYSKISAQAEHTQALLLDTQWQGVTHDAQMLIEREAEAARLAQEEAERQERERIEAEEAAAAAAAAAELAAQKRAAGGDVKRGVRGRGRGVAVRGATASVRGTSSVGAGRSSSMADSSAPSTRGTVTGVRGVRGLRSRVMTRGGVASGRGRGE
ncbi:hypothetical protein OIO90_003869 [Microbotryomycetes sp. JL221]|nr:hypothetical protein OIO90_003869 [Microbotryomycetes sp. JL221]